MRRDGELLAFCVALGEMPHCVLSKIFRRLLRNEESVLLRRRSLIEMREFSGV